MSFLSPIFLFAFLPIAAICYRLARTPKLQSAVWIAAGLLFYAFGDVRHLPLLLCSCALHYGAGRFLMAAKRRRRLALGLCATVDLAVLALYKIKGALPLGISFYTFQAISYVVDTYRTPESGTKSVRELLQYLTFFPQLTTGPFMKFSALRPFFAAREDNWDGALQGLRRFVCGLFKKLFLSAAAAKVADAMFGLTAMDALGAWTGAVSYCLQLYFDFSGYSDMALGLGLLFGVRLPENFRYPYCAGSVTEFWRRWHMTLSGWFRDYVYIPLGGNRVKRWKHIRNILVVWFLTGFWHGAAWNFLLWGGFFGLVLIGEKYLWGRGLARLPAALQWAVTMLLVTLSFVLFNADGLAGAAQDLRCLFTGPPPVSTEALYQLRSYGVLLLLAAVGATPLPRRAAMWLDGRFPRAAAWLEPVLLAGLLLVSTAWLVDGSFNPFLYFRF